MTRTETLRAETDRRRAVFFFGASTLSEQMRPTRLLDDVVGAFDPHFERLNRFEAEVKRNPFALLVAVGGLWLLARQLTRNEPPTKSVTRHGMRPHRLPRTTLKGDENGYINDPKQH